MKLKVTIGVCARNSASTICEAIESIIDQDFPPELLEIVFVDDGSEDDTLAIIQAYVSRMDIAARVFHTEWQGLGPARNIVVNNTRGKYIIWVDGDMILPADHVRKQVEFMELNPKVGIAKAKYGRTAKDGTVAALENAPFMVYDTKLDAVNSKLPGTGGAIFRLEALRQVGGFDSGLKGTGEDQDVAYRIRAAGWVLDRSPAVFFERRVRTWKSLWAKYFWYGYGDHDLYCKNRGIFSPSRMNPLAGFVAGALQIPDAYRITSCKSVLLLPFHFAFKMMAWCAGFSKARLDSRQFVSTKVT